MVMYSRGVSLLSRGVLLCLMLFLVGCATVERMYYSVPGMLPGTNADMKSVGYWIDRHPSPDRIVMNGGDIKRFNASITDEREITTDIFTLPDRCPADLVREKVRVMVDWFRSRTLYHDDGGRAGGAFFDEMERRMGMQRLSDPVTVRFGVVTRYADQRVFPAAAGLYSKRGDVDFDELQNNALDVGTPVAIMHESIDGAWYYVVDELNAGWVKKESIALTERHALECFAKAADFVVVTAPRVSLYRDRSLTGYAMYARTGTCFPLVGFPDGETVEIVVPLRDRDGSCTYDHGFVARRGVHKGFLPYTPRSILSTSFNLLNAPYGWGGMYGERDCSRFVQSVFATVGIRLPRNSSKQALVGCALDDFGTDVSPAEKENRIIEKGVGGITLLYMKGHIMIYLGSEQGKAYAVHDTWGYRIPTWRGDIVRVIGRTAVTDLHLGERSRKGSYLDRIISVRAVVNDGVRE